MIDQDNVQRHRKALEAFNRRDLDAVIGVYSADILATDHAQQQTLKSPQTVRSWNEAWLEASLSPHSRRSAFQAPAGGLLCAADAEVVAPRSIGDGAV